MDDNNLLEDSSSYALSHNYDAKAVNFFSKATLMVISIGIIFSIFILVLYVNLNDLESGMDSNNDPTMFFEKSVCSTCREVLYKASLNFNEETRGLLDTNIVIYAYESVEPGSLEELVTEQRLGIVVLSPVDLVKNSDSLEDLRYDLESDIKLNEIVKKVTANGGTVEVVVANNLPKWLSSDPSNVSNIFSGVDGEKIWHTVPPKNYSEWQNLVEVIVNHFSNTLGANVIYTFGSEPDNYFVGSEDEFFEMYKFFVRGALFADPQAKVGGPTPSNYKSNFFAKDNPYASEKGTGFVGSATINNAPIIKNFIMFAKDNNLPINHISYHQYPAPSPIPLFTADWVTAEKDISGWLTEAGYNNTKIILADWPEWKQSMHSDTSYQAAWVASSLVSMAKYTNRTTPTYLGLRDLNAFSGRPTIENGGFVGGNGLFTSHGIKKPIFNLYSALSAMKGNLFTVDSDDDFAVGLGSVATDTVSILLVNFIPQNSLIIKNSFGIAVIKDEAQAALIEILKQTGLDSYQDLFNAMVSGLVKMDDLVISNPELKDRFSKIQALMLDASERRDQPIRSVVKLTGIDQGDWKVEEYVIDATHANSYTAKGEITSFVRSEDSLTNEVIEELVDSLNQKTSLEHGKVRSEMVTVEKDFFQLMTVQEPNSVSLIIMRKNKIK